MCEVDGSNYTIFANNCADQLFTEDEIVNHYIVDARAVRKISNRTPLYFQKRITVLKSEVFSFFI